MKTFSKKLILPVIALISILIAGWGGTGHFRINTNSSLSFNQEMQDFHAWTEYLAEHASDADYRKDDDPSEAPKHYIDIDNYYAFMLTGRIPSTFDSVLSLYGNSYVYDNGILPWATEATVNALQQAFEDRNFETAKQLAADLGHYVGDGHMPLHITRNYDGQYTGNNGIHSRYETSMVNAFADEIQYEGDSIAVVPDVNAYIFNYLYRNYHYIDSVLLADNYARTMGSTNSQAYKQALWEKTGDFTIDLMKRASHSLTELIYTAWVNAGSPSLSASGYEEPDTYSAGTLISVGGSSSKNLRIVYSLNRNTTYQFYLTDLSGKTVASSDQSFGWTGTHTTEWNLPDLPSGIYLVTLQTPFGLSTRKHLITKY